MQPISTRVGAGRSAWHDRGVPHKTITLYMWGFQDTFRRGVEMDFESALRSIGVSVEPTAVLIGLLVPGGDRHQLCIEPEDGPIIPADFDGLGERAAELYDQDPDSQLRFTDQRSHERKHQEFRHRAYGTAIAEVLQAKLGLRFFVALPTQVDQHLVFTAVGLPEWVLDARPHLKSTIMADRYPVTQSLVQGVINEILRSKRQALYEPDAGAGLDSGDDSTARIAGAAGRAVTLSATVLAGNVVPTMLFDGLNQVATTGYERRVGTGSLLIADPSSPYIDHAVALRQPVRISDTRTLRKLLETSRRQGDSLLTDGDDVYGLGRLKEDYPGDESVFQVLVVGNGIWELHHADVALATVEFGTPRLPRERVRRERFSDVCRRVLGECDSDALWALTMSAADAEHGTMLVISKRAADEAERLATQALTIEATTLDDGLVRQFTSIDGAVLVDPSGNCHAIGVILDGTATTEGDRSRGARFNSAKKYLASVKKEEIATVILIVSEDGMIDLLPDLREKMSRAELEAMLNELRDAARIDPVHAEKFYKAYRPVEAKAFYLSSDQIEEVNALVVDHWERRKAAGATLWINEPPLVVDPQMSDDYLVD